MPLEDGRPRDRSAARAALSSRHVGDHRQHDPQVRARARPEAAPATWVRNSAGRSSAMRMARQPMRRIVLLAGAEIGQHLVAADIERAEHHRLVAGGVEDRLVERGLLLEPREASPTIMNCSSVRNRPMPSAPDCVEMRQVDQQAGIDVQRDALAVDASPRAVSRSAAYLRLAARAEPHLVGIGRDRPRARPHMHLAAFGIDDDRHRPPRRAPCTPLPGRRRQCRARAPRWRHGSSRRLPRAPGRADAVRS